MTAITRFIVLTWWATLAASGALGLLSMVTQWVFDSRVIGSLAGLVDLVAFATAVLGWFAVAITPRMPLRVALPLLIVQIWLVLGFMPFALLAYGTPWLSGSMGAISLIAVLLSMALARSLGPGLGPNQAAMDGRPEYSPLRSVVWVGSSVTIVPALILLYLVGSASWTLSYGTGDFVRLTATGLSFARKTYVQDARTVDLIAMVHIGEPESYDLLFGPVRDLPDAVVLSEGVSDKDKLLGDIGGSYSGAADNLGLAVQDSMDKLTGLPERNADVDVSSFDPVTLELLGVVFKLYDGVDTQKDLTAYLDFWSRHQADAPELVEQLFDDILLGRNEHLLGEIEDASEQHIVVPWGALHMAEVGPTLEERGWTHQSTERVVLIHWSTLWQTL